MNLFISIVILLFTLRNQSECHVHFSLRQAVPRIIMEIAADDDFQAIAQDTKTLQDELIKCVDFDLHNQAFINYCLKVACQVMLLEGCQSKREQTDFCIFSTHYLQRFTMSKWARDVK